MSNYVRTIDGTSIHSHGLTRLKDSFNTQIGCLIIVQTNMPMAMMYPYNILSNLFATAAGAIASHALEHYWHKALYPKEFKTSCYDTEPKSPKPLSPQQQETLKLYSGGKTFMVLTCLVAGLGFLTKASLTNSPTNLFLSTMLLSFAAISQQSTHRIHKVLEGEWTLGKTPKQNKKMSLTELSILEKLSAWVAKPLPSYSPIPK